MPLHYTAILVCEAHLYVIINRACIFGLYYNWEYCTNNVLNLANNISVQDKITQMTTKGGLSVSNGCDYCIYHNLCIK